MDSSHNLRKREKAGFPGGQAPASSGLAGCGSNQIPTRSLSPTSLQGPPSPHTPSLYRGTLNEPMLLKAKLQELKVLATLLPLYPLLLSLLLLRAPPTSLSSFAPLWVCHQQLGDDDCQIVSLQPSPLPEPRRPSGPMLPALGNIPHHHPAITISSLDFQHLCCLSVTQDRHLDPFPPLPQLY